MVGVAGVVTLYYQAVSQLHTFLWLAMFALNPGGQFSYGFTGLCYYLNLDMELIQKEKLMLSTTRLTLLISLAF